MARIFLSHSSKNNAIAIQFHDWLVANGWADIFLDLDPSKGLTPGQRWQEELKRAAETCEAVLFLVSPAWLASRWCLAEFLLAKQLGKKIFPIIIEAVPFDDLPHEMTVTHQVVDLVADPQGYVRLQEGLLRAGLGAESFAFPPGRRPYPGLEALSEQDAAIFFGRDAQIIRAMDNLRSMRDAGVDRTFIILGASGAGKSSFLKAGLWPRLNRDTSAFVVLPVIRPGRAIISEPGGLAAAIVAGLRNSALSSDVAAQALKKSDRIPTELVQESAALGRYLAMLSADGRTTILSIDQGEELLNAEGRAEALPFLSALADAMQANRNIVTVISIRSDAFPQLQVHETFSRFPHVPFSLLPMSPGSFRQIIEGPAHVAGLKLDPLLVDQLLADTTGAQSAAADALPLLAFSLGRLYHQHGQKGGLTLSDFSSQGGRSGTIMAAVDEALREGATHHQLPPVGRETEDLIRRAFIPHLIRVDDAGSYARRLADYQAFPEDCRTFVDLLVSKRLLMRERRVIGERTVDTVEIAHEALIREWPQLRALVDDARELLEWRKQIDRSYEFYASAPAVDKADALLSGLQLSRALRWVAVDPHAVNEQIRDFVIRSSLRNNPAATRGLSLFKFVSTGWLALAFLLILGCGMAVPQLTPEQLLTDWKPDLPFVRQSISLGMVGRFVPLAIGLTFVGFMLSLLLLRRSILAARTHLDQLGARPLDEQWLRPLMGPDRAARRATALISLDIRSFWLVMWLIAGLVSVALILLLCFQGAFLKVHDETLTWMQRAGLLLLLGAAFGVARALGSLVLEFRARSWSRLFVGSAMTVAIVALVSLGVLTVPQERLELALGLSKHGPFQPRFVDRFIARTYDFRNAKLAFQGNSSPVDMRFADFRGATVAGTLVVRNLDGANLEDAVIESLSVGCDYPNVGEGASIRDIGESETIAPFVVGSAVDVRQPVFASLCGTASAASFRRAKINSLSADRMALQQIDFRDASIEVATFEGSVLYDVDWTGAKIAYPTFKRTLIAKSKFDNAQMPAALFTLSSIVGTSFKNTRLDAASFRRAAVVDSDFGGASLGIADWRLANVASSSILQARDLSAIDFRGATLWDIAVRETSFRAASKHADFRDVRVAPPKFAMVPRALPVGEAEKLLRAAIFRVGEMRAFAPGEGEQQLERGGAQLIARTSPRDAVNEVFDAVLCDEALRDPWGLWPSAFLNRAFERAYAGFYLMRIERQSAENRMWPEDRVRAGLDQFNGRFSKVWFNFRAAPEGTEIQDRCVKWAWERARALDTKISKDPESIMGWFVKLIPAEWIGSYPFISEFEDRLSKDPNAKL